MKPISEFIVTVDAAETELKKAVVAAFKAIDEAKVHFIEVYNAARVTMEAEVASREQGLRETVARAVEALNGDLIAPSEAPSEAPPELPPTKALEVAGATGVAEEEAP